MSLATRTDALPRRTSIPFTAPFNLIVVSERNPTISEVSARSVLRICRTKSILRTCERGWAARPQATSPGFPCEWIMRCCDWQENGPRRRVRPWDAG